MAVGYVLIVQGKQPSSQVMAGSLTVILACLGAWHSQHPWMDESEEAALVAAILAIFAFFYFVTREPEAQTRMPLALGIIMTMALVGFVAWQSQHPWVDEFEEIAAILSVPFIFSVGYYAVSALKHLFSDMPTVVGVNSSIQRSLGGLLTVALVCFACWHRAHPWIDEVEEIALVLSVISFITFLMVAVALVSVLPHILMFVTYVCVGLAVAFRCDFPLVLFLLLMNPSTVPWEIWLITGAFLTVLGFCAAAPFYFFM